MGTSIPRPASPRRDQPALRLALGRPGSGADGTSVVAQFERTVWARPARRSVPILSVSSGSLGIMKMTETQNVLRRIELGSKDGLTREEIARQTGLGETVVRLITKELEYNDIISEDDSRYSFTAFGTEILFARSAEA
jgi:hypothetical protein